MQTNTRQLCALGFSAFTVPAVLLLPRLGWLWATAAATLCALFLAFLLLLRRKSGRTLTELAGASVAGRAVLVLTLVWNLLMLGASARQLCAVYPTANSPLIGLLLLLLAAWAAQKGTETVLRVGAIVFFFLLGFFALILGFALPDLRVGWLRPETRLDAAFLPAVLTPAVALWLDGGEERRPVWPWLTSGVVFAALCALVTQGSLSQAVASAEAFPFYSAAKSVNLLGAMERLEPLVSAAMTAGGFCLLSLLCAVNTRLLAHFFPEPSRFAALLHLACGAGAMWLSARLPAALLGAGTAIFWGLVPLVIQFVGFSKNLNFFEKRA